MTLRTRLSLLLALIVSGVAVVMGGAAVQVAYDTSMGSVDQALTTVASRATGAKQDGLTSAVYAASLQQEQIAVALLADAAPPTWLRLGDAVTLSERALVAAGAKGLDTVEDGRSYRVLQARLADGDAVLLAVDVTPLRDEWRTNLRVLLVIAALLALLAATGSRLLVRRDLRRVQALTATADRIAAGDLDAPLPAAVGVSEVDLLSDSLRRMVSSLQQSYQELQASHGHLRTFLGDVSHELRTPLTVVRGYVELLENADHLTDEVRDRAVSRSLAEIERMQALIADLLLLAEFTEQRRPEFAPVDLVDVVRDSLLDLMTLQPERMVHAQLPTAPALIDGDRRALQSLCANLFGNIRRHTPVSAPVQVSLAESDGLWRLVVEDGGPGLSEAQYAVRVDDLQRFSRMRSETTGGSGLGLRIIATVARMHGGTIALSPSTLGGVRVECSLPRERQ